MGKIAFKTRRRTVLLDEDLVEQVRETTRLQTLARSFSDEYAAALRKTVEVLIARGYSRAMTGDLLRLTRQRVCQILEEVELDGEDSTG